MGSAMSPLLFCLALDPLLHLVHCIPRIRVVRAYMDDNQIAGEGLDWIGQAQRQYQAFETAGLIAVQHRCCRFWPAHLPAPVEGKGVASWRIAALRSLSRYPHQLLFRCCGFPGTFTRREIWQIALRRAPGLLRRLIRLPCECKIKTSLLLDGTPTAKQYAKLDSLPWGGEDNRLLSYSPWASFAILPHIAAQC